MKESFNKKCRKFILLLKNRKPSRDITIFDEDVWYNSAYSTVARALGNIKKADGKDYRKWREENFEKMKKMMFENGGCGLAAPQIGELIQLVTIDCDYSDKNDYDPYVLINPVIVEQSDHLVPFSEGCLSIPGISCEIERPDHVVVEAYDLDANLIRYEASGDLFCVCLQHEIDHLHGNTMFERLKPMQRLKAVKEYQDALARGARPGETE